MSPFSVQKTVWLMGLICVVGLHSVQAAGVLQLPLEGDLGLPVQPHVISEPDGTKIEWTEFYKSTRSHISVGRSNIHGPLLPSAKLDYTDCFYVARGRSRVIVEGKTHDVRAGDFVLLPRGARVEAHDFKDYVHFAAAFETGPDDHSNGPLELRRFQPQLLKDTDFKVEGESMRHVYYRGAAGVVVRAWQSTKVDMATEFFPSPWSELSFIVSGTGTIADETGTVKSLKAGDTLFIARGDKIKLTSHNMRKLAIVFDQDTPDSHSN